MTVALMTALPTIVTKIEDGIAGDGIDTTDDEDVTYNHPGVVNLVNLGNFFSHMDMEEREKRGRKKGRRKEKRERKKEK
jgi:hypothetical protein